MQDYREIIKGIPKLTLDRVEFANLLGLKNNARVSSKCPYRYDKDSGLIYIDDTDKNARYTYIAKSNCVDVYKVGRTADLSKRDKTLRSHKPYSFLDMEILAYSAEDYEMWIKAFSNSRYNCLPKPFDTANELLFLSEDDIEYILNICDFQKIIGGELPGKLERTTRSFFDPLSGEYMYSKTITHFR